MINDIQADAGAGPSRRILAVVAGAEERAREVSERFAAAGDVVETRWYADPGALLEQAGRPRFEAVILFAHGDEAATDAEENRLRDGLADTPLFRVA